MLSAGLTVESTNVGLKVSRLPSPHLRHEDQKLKVILGYIASARPSWATRSCSKKLKQTNRPRESASEMAQWVKAFVVQAW